MKIRRESSIVEWGFYVFALFVLVGVMVFSIVRKVEHLEPDPAQMETAK